MSLPMLSKKGARTPSIGAIRHSIGAYTTHLMEVRRGNWGACCSQALSACTTRFTPFLNSTCNTRLVLGPGDHRLFPASLALLSPCLILDDEEQQQLPGAYIVREAAAGEEVEVEVEAEMQAAGSCSVVKALTRMPVKGAAHIAQAGPADRARQNCPRGSTLGDA
jgi:hypothetical protein